MRPRVGRDYKHCYDSTTNSERFCNDQCWCCALLLFLCVRTRLEPDFSLIYFAESLAFFTPATVRLGFLWERERRERLLFVFSGVHILFFVWFCCWRVDAKASFRSRQESAALAGALGVRPLTARPQGRGAEKRTSEPDDWHRRHLFSVSKKNCSSLKGKTQRSAVGAPLTLTHSPHPLPLAEHIYLRASFSAFSLPVIRPRRAPSLGV